MKRNLRVLHCIRNPSNLSAYFEEWIQLMKPPEGFEKFYDKDKKKKPADASKPSQSDPEPKKSTSSPSSDDTKYKLSFDFKVKMG